jgi:hypothetical protein
MKKALIPLAGRDKKEVGQMTAEMTYDEKLAKAKARITDEYSWFDANRDRIITGHHGEEAVIQNHRVLGYFPDLGTADDYMLDRGEEQGTYTIQRCMTKDEELENCITIYALTGVSCA